jgi:hypothetical protein
MNVRFVRLAACAAVAFCPPAFRADDKKAAAPDKATTEEVMKRWNASAGKVTVTPPDFAKVDFQWKAAGQFPHPTFKGGSAEAYGAFAEAYLAFLRAGDNFDYLAKNGLFDAKFGFGGTGKVSFRELAEQFAKPKAHGSHSEANRKALADFAAKMKSPPKK